MAKGGCLQPDTGSGASGENGEGREVEAEPGRAADGRTEPLTLLYTEFATILAMTHILLPFMVLPLYSVMKTIDPSYMRAAMSMGARPIRAWYSVYLPASLPGLSAGAMLVFIISVGYYITPALVGGTDGQMISTLIAFHMQQSNNWGLAAALGRSSPSPRC